MALRIWGTALLLALSTTPDRTLTDGSVRGLFGWSFGLADFNGDGLADVLVGATNPLVPRNGRAYLFHGAAGGLTAAPVWSITGSDGTEQLGSAVGGTRLNGDGFPDGVIGAPFSAISDSAGRVLIFFGQPDAPPPAPTPLHPPTDLAQASHPGGEARAAGFVDDDSAMAFRGVVTSDGSGTWLEVEVKANGTAFDGSASRQGDVITASAGTSEVVFTDLGDGAYHWRARAASSAGGVSDWVEFHPDPAADVSIDTTGSAPPTPEPPPPPGNNQSQVVVVDDDDDDDGCGALGADVLLVLLLLRAARRRIRRRV